MEPNSDDSNTLVIDCLNDGGLLLTTLEEVSQALLAKGLHVVTTKEKAVLDAIESALSRLGDDPPYYEVYDNGDCEDGIDLFTLNPKLAKVLNTWTRELTLDL